MLLLRGKVQPGKKRGKGLGFPTANIQLNKIIEEGVYISQTNIEGQNYNSLTFIGAAKTFGETDKKAETYILSFKREIYGKQIKVKLIKKIRENQKFASLQDLTEQMQKDLKEALLYFKRAEEH